MPIPSVESPNPCPRQTSLGSMPEKGKPQLLHSPYSFIYFMFSYKVITRKPVAEAN